MRNWQLGPMCLFGASGPCLSSQFYPSPAVLLCLPVQIFTSANHTVSCFSAHFSPECCYHCLFAFLALLLSHSPACASYMILLIFHHLLFFHISGFSPGLAMSECASSTVSYHLQVLLTFHCSSFFSAHNSLFLLTLLASLCTLSPCRISSLPTFNVAP
ncbi:UNVERIFIED_CONTAM: hypothetical protein K2H54_062827 [Gekko kuhli]